MRSSPSSQFTCHPGSRVSGYPGPTVTAAPWVPALAPLGRDDILFLIQSERSALVVGKPDLDGHTIFYANRSGDVTLACEAFD
jgi:hypothetical protein